MLTCTKRIVMVVCLLAGVIAAIASSSVPAATWHTNKGTSGPAYSGAFTATASTLAITGANGGQLICSAATIGGTFGGPAFVATQWPAAAWGTVTGSGCTVPGTPPQPVNVTCSFVLTAASYSGTASSPALSGVTTGTIALTGPAAGPAGCSVVRRSIEICKIIGAAIPATYTNPSTVGGADGRLTVQMVDSASGQLDIENGSSCPLGAGPATLSWLSFVTAAPAPVPISWFTVP